MGVLERAVMVPEDCEWMPGTREYPTPGAGLMVDPNPKAKKKKMPTLVKILTMVTVL